MNKKVIGMIVVVLLICAVGIGAYLLFGIKTNDNETINNNLQENVTESEKGNEGEDNDTNTTSNKNGKVLVVYFSATNNTKNVAEKIAKNLNGDTFEIVPEDIYTSEDLDWTDSDSRVSREHDDESLRNIKLKNTTVSNWSDYDTILIGYPIWWGVAAWPVDTFVTSNNFNGKTVIPFCTSSSSGLGQSGKLLEAKANGGNWVEGHRFSSYASDSDIKTFTDNII